MDEASGWSLNKTDDLCEKRKGRENERVDVGNDGKIIVIFRKMKNECPPVQMMLLIEELKLNEVPFNIEFAVIQMQLKQCQSRDKVSITTETLSNL